jgi:DNA-binding helix-hairpin-helix protein with protein kinase domain
MAVVKLLPDSRDLPEQLFIRDQPVHSGGEGTIYFTTDNRYVVKVYHRPSPEKPKLLSHILDLGKTLGDDEQYLAWPLGIINQVNGKAHVGVVTRRVPSTHQALVKLIYSPVDAVEQFRLGRSWLEYLKIARGTAAAVRAIHGKGMAHGDVHLKNFLANPTSAEVVMIDLDGLIVKGFLPPQVKGMPGFIAPEVVMGISKPDELTDRYSLAVLVLWILLLRNVMLTQICYDPDDQMHDDELGYGKYACFSENPGDRRNWIPRIGTPLFRRGALSIRTLTPKLQELTDRALIQGLHTPSKRPMSYEWENALAEAYDALICCPICRQSFFYQYWLQPPQRRQCPFCGTGVRAPLPAVLNLMEERTKGTYVYVRSVVLYHGLPIFVDIIESGRLPPFARRGTLKIGQVLWDPKEYFYRLINITDTPWQIISGGSGSVGHGDSVVLRKGLLLCFGPGKRLASVVE